MAERAIAVEKAILLTLARFDSVRQAASGWLKGIRPFQSADASSVKENAGPKAGAFYSVPLLAQLEHHAPIAFSTLQRGSI